MKCFEDIVTLRGCNIEETPGAIYYLNSLPGISLKSIEQIANSEQQNYIGVFDDIKHRASIRISNQIQSHLSKRYKLIKTRRAIEIADVKSEQNLIPTNNFRGLNIRTTGDQTDNYTLSPFQIITVESIKIYIGNLTTQNNLDIIFFDWITKEILHTINIDPTTLTADSWNTIIVRKSFSVGSLGIGYNDDKVWSKQYSVNNLNRIWGACVDECYGYDCGRIQGFVSSTATVNGVLSQSDIVSGIQANVSIGCSYDSAICFIRTQFAEAYWYLCGIEFMTERLYTERINFYTSVKREEAKELIDLYSIRYEEAMTNAIEGVRFDCDVCLECNPIVDVFHNIP
jgi:hypothetical protein